MKDCVSNKTDLLPTLIIRHTVYLPTSIVLATDLVIRALAVDPRDRNITHSNW